jgi:dTDP-4-dehydrorhamnose reductase
VILRTSLVFGAAGNNVLTRTLQQIEAGEDIVAVTDQKENPTSADSVAAALVTIATAILGGKGHGFGTFHICDEGAVTRLEFAQAIIDAYTPLTTRRPKLTGIASTDMPGRVPRPACTMLDCGKTRAIYGIESRPWRDEITAAVRRYAEQGRDKT